MRRLVGRQFRWMALCLCGAALLAGCGNGSEAPNRPAATYAGVSLKIGAIGDPPILASVSPLLGEWQASRKGSLSILAEPITLESISTPDVLLFPAQRLGDLVDAGALAIIPNSMVLPPKPSESELDEQSRRGPSAVPEGPDDPFQYLDIAPGFRDQVSRYGPDLFALPCGGSALVLIYRRDAFGSEPNRAAARQAGLELKPPVLWTELDALAKFFQGRDWNGDGAPDYGLALALGADTMGEGVADASFLARAASLGQHRDQFSFLFESDTMAPRVDTPPFVEALRSLVALKEAGPPGMGRFDAEAARESFRSGKVAMLIDRAERASKWSHGKPIDVAPVPGSDRVFEPARKEWGRASPPNAPSYLPHGGGWLIGINRRLSGKQHDAAVDFVKYLANPENSNRIRSEPTFPMLPVRISQMGEGLPDPTAAPDVDSRLWSDAVRRTLLGERIVPGLRIAGADDYLKDLANGRIAAVNGESPEKALQSVARAWVDRTAARGPKRQRWHYQRSLNTMATLPQPPEPGK
jgi:multiple sugar transport system substrate-binding protein